jgi:hypothetical protein
MKKTILIFVLCILQVGAFVLWSLKSHSSGSVQEILRAGAVLVLVGFAFFLGVSRLRSRRRREPAEDEMSKGVMTRASSLAYYISLYLWLFVMYISDQLSIPSYSLIGVGIVGMAVVFLFCWLGVKFFGPKND